MAGVQASAMAVAVSNAGGLGSLPCTMLSTQRPEQVCSKILCPVSVLSFQTLLLLIGLLFLSGQVYQQNYQKLFPFV
jgi:NAD(P)H-dependent flavin oxidoreductase YrpB (nitropropane dioxygenase family)